VEELEKEREKAKIAMDLKPEENNKIRSFFKDGRD